MHATEKSLEELGDKVEADERGRIESAISDLKEALKGDQKETIETKAQALSEASASLAQRVYEEAQAAAGDEAGGAGAEGGTPHGDDDVVDAEFEEVKDGDSKPGAA